MSKLRGFGGLSPERRKEVSAMGGRAVPREKRGFYLDRELAKSAGSAGGTAQPKGSRPFAMDRELASRAGKLGAESPKRK